MKTLADKAGMLILANLSKYAIGLITPMLLVRLMSKYDFGTYQQLVLIGTLAVGTMTLGLPMSVYYFYGDDRRRSALVSQTLVMLATSGLIAALVIGLGASLLGASMNNPQLKDLLPVYAFYVLFMIASEHFVHFLVSMDRYRSAVAFESGEAVVRVVFLTTPLLLGFDLRGLVISAGLYALLRFLARSFVLFRVTPKGLRALRFNFVRQHLGYSVPLALSSLTKIIGGVLDRALIALTFTPMHYAIYAVGAFEIPLDTILQASVANVLRASLPELVRSGKHGAVAGIWRESVRKLALVVIPIFLFLAVFSAPFIALLFTKGYAESVYVFRIYLLLMPLQIMVLSLLPQVYGMTRINLYVSLFSVGTNVVVSLILLKTIGFYGPAIATVLSSYTASAIYFAVALRLTGATALDLFPLAAVTRIAFVATFAAGIARIVAPHESDFFTLLVGGLVFFAAYLVGGSWLGIFTADDKALVQRWAGRLIASGKV